MSEWIEICFIDNFSRFSWFPPLQWYLKFSIIATPLGWIRKSGTINRPRVMIHSFIGKRLVWFNIVCGGWAWLRSMRQLRGHCGWGGSGLRGCGWCWHRIIWWWWSSFVRRWCANYIEIPWVTWFVIRKNCVRNEYLDSFGTVTSFTSYLTYLSIMLSTELVGIVATLTVEDLFDIWCWMFRNGHKDWFETRFDLNFLWLAHNVLVRIFVWA